jgi:hypothetical protein
VDCGVFVIKYVEMILSANPTSTPEDICTEFHDYFQPLMFSQTDADVERIKFINDIDVYVYMYLIAFYPSDESLLLSSLSECWSELCRRREALRRERATGLRCAGSTSTVRISSVPVDEGNAEETESSDDSSKPEEEGKQVCCPLDKTCLVLIKIMMISGLQVLLISLAQKKLRLARIGTVRGTEAVVAAPVAALTLAAISRRRSRASSPGK